MDHELTDRLKQVEERLSQVLQATEQQRESHSRWFLMFGFFAATLLAGFIVYLVTSSFIDRSSPPKNLQMVQVPVKINDQVMMVGMRVEGWQIPDGENLLKNIQLVAEKRAFEQVMAAVEKSSPDEIKKAISEASQPPAYMNINPAFTFWWAFIATLIVLFLLLMQLFGKSASTESIER